MNQWARRQNNGTYPEQKNEKIILNSEDNLRDICNNIKWNNIYITGVPEGDEREKEPEKLFEEIVAENILNLRKETDI